MHIRLAAALLPVVCCVAAAAQPPATPRTLDALVTNNEGGAAALPPLIRHTQKRFPVPNADAVQGMRAVVSKAFAADLQEAQTNPDATIFKLLGAADATPDLAKKYAVLLEAERLAQESQSLRQVIELVDGRTAAFEEDPVRSRLEALSRCTSQPDKTRPEMLRDACDVALATARTAAEWEQFTDAVEGADIAQRCAKAFLASAKARKNLALTDEATKRQRAAKDLASLVRIRKERHAEFEQALDTIKSEPDDEGANRAIGTYYCFEKGDWKRGLPALARSGDAELAELAASELQASRTKAREPHALFTVAGRWWDYAESKGGSQGERARAHSSDLYGVVAPLLTDAIDRQLAATRGAPKDSSLLGTLASATEKTQKQRLTIEFDEPEVLDLFDTSGRVLITQGELELGGGRERQFSWARTKDSFTYPIRVEYEIIALPDATWDMFPGLFCKLDDFGRDGLHLHWGFDGNRRTDVLVFGQRTHMKHTKLVPGFNYTVVFEVDRERVFTIGVEKFKLFRAKVPEEVKLEGPVLCGGGFGHVAYRRLVIDGVRVPR